MKAFLKQTTFYGTVILGRFFLNALIVTGFTNNIGLCIGARFWPLRANSQIAKIK